MDNLIPDNATLVLALKSINDCVCISDMNDNIIFINESFLHTYGYLHEELLGKPTHMLRSAKNDPETVLSVFSETLKGGWQGELINRRKDGSDFPVKIATSVIRDDSGNPIALMSVAKDITEIKRTQSKFRSVADLFQNLGTDSTMNVQTIVDCAFRVIGGTASMYYKLDDRASSLVLLAGYNLPSDIDRTVAPNGHICYEEIITGQKGPVVLCDLTQTIYMQTDPTIARYGLKAYLGAPVLRRGKVIGALAIVDAVERNFTPEEIDLIGILASALSQEEERQDVVTLLQTAVLQSPSGILIADAPDERIRIANSKAMDILLGDKNGAEPGLNGTTRSWDCFQLDRMPLSVDNLPLARAIRQGETIEGKELIIRTCTGIERFVSVNAAPVRNNEGIITAAVVTFHDNTAKHEAESALKEKVEQLERFNNLMVGREMKMIDLKKEVNNLLIQSGQQVKYIIHE